MPDPLVPKTWPASDREKFIKFDSHYNIPCVFSDHTSAQNIMHHLKIRPCQTSAFLGEIAATGKHCFSSNQMEVSLRGYWHI
jgi:hypothetical protein